MEIYKEFRFEAAHRLPNVPADLIERILARDLAACEEAVALCQAAWTNSDESVASLDLSSVRPARREAVVPACAGAAWR